jgi:hypothetical protein
VQVERVHSQIVLGHPCLDLFMPQPFVAWVA